MTTNQAKSETSSSYFIQKHSAMIRIWHWITFIIITASIITVLLNSVWMDPRSNIGMVQEQLNKKGVTVSDDQAFSVSHEYEDKIWGLHKWVGYALALLLFSRIIIELAEPAEEKSISRIKNALGLYRINNINRPEYLHYLRVKFGYLMFYLLLFCMTITGLGLAFGRNLGFSRELHGTIKEIHSIGQYFMYAFVIIHLGGVIIGENSKIKGVVSGMINGNK
jgi:Ni/Fe-hydrogenase 1 B-type cytochrome subunit